MLWRPTRTFLDIRTTRCRPNQRALARRVDSWSMDALFLFGNTSRFRADDRKWDALGDERYFDWIRARQSHWTIAFLRNARVTLVHSHSRSPGNRLCQFSIGEGIPIKKRSPLLIVYNVELITSFATRTCISYRCAKRVFFSPEERNPVALKSINNVSRERLSLARDWPRSESTF